MIIWEGAPSVNLSLPFVVPQIIIFDIKVPITTGASVRVFSSEDIALLLTLAFQVELFHHSRDNPATISKLLATLDRGTGNVIKSNPR